MEQDFVHLLGVVRSHCTRRQDLHVVLDNRGRRAVLLWHGDDPDVSFLDHLDTARWREQLAVVVVNREASFREIVLHLVPPRP